MSRYDERGPAWYWNNFSCSEHTGTHFDAPIHWVSGKDQPNNSVDTIPTDAFIAQACVIDCSAQSREDPDFLLTVDFVEQWEDRKSVVSGKSVSVRVDLGGRRIIKKKKRKGSMKAIHKVS